MGRLDRERGGLGFSGAGEQATSQESGLLGGSRQGEPQQTAFPILLFACRIRGVRLPGKEGPREQEPGKGQQKEGMRKRERESERETEGGGRGREREALFFLSRGETPRTPPLQAWLAGGG